MAQLAEALTMCDHEECFHNILCFGNRPAAVFGTETPPAAVLDQRTTATRTPTATPTLAPPSSLTLSTVSDAQLNLAWRDNSRHENGFQIAIRSRWMRKRP